MARRLGEAGAPRKDTRLHRRAGGAILRASSSCDRKKSMSSALLFLLALQAAPQTPAPATPAPVVEPSAEDEQEFFTLFDADKNGTIDKAEFDKMVAQIDAEASKQDPSQKGQAASGLATAFALFDQNKDAKITRAEFRAVVKAGQ